MSYCVYQMWAAPSGLLYPVKPVEPYRRLELAEAQSMATQLNIGPTAAAYQYNMRRKDYAPSILDPVAKHENTYTSPRQSKFYDVVKCEKCECEKEEGQHEISH